MLTAMIWRMERRTVVAAMVGGNWSMDETLDAIWAEVTIQSNALLPVLRLMALRAMKKKKRNTTERLGGKAQYFLCPFSLQSVKAGSQEQLPQAPERRAMYHTAVVFSCIKQITVEFLSSLNFLLRPTMQCYSAVKY